jgi:Tol biopolymer transport system component
MRKERFAKIVAPLRLEKLRAMLAILGCLLMLHGSQQASAQTPIGPPFCSFQQISDPRVGNAYPTSMSADGSRIVFVSTKSTESDTTTTFLLLDTNTSTLMQIASFTESSLRRRIQSLSLISADGSRVAFASPRNLTGQNADGNVEVFLFTVATGTLIQVTDTTTGSHFVSSLNADGSQIIISSYTEPTQENPYGNPEFFRLDVHTGVSTPVIHTPFTFLVSLVSFNADATRVLFSTTADPTGTNPDGNEEVFLLDTTTDSLTQITNTTTGNSSPSAISPDGTHLLIESTANLTGENVAQTPQLFLFELPRATFTQLTHATEGYFDFKSFFSADGTRIVFTSSANLLGDNLDTDEANSSLASKIFLFDTTTYTLTQITRNGTSPILAMSADGSRIGFVFAPKVILVGADLRGYGPDVAFDATYPLFLATCAFPDAQSPTIKAAVESPEPGPVSGVAVIRGWAFSTRENATVDHVTLLVDGEPIGDAPCCSERIDVSADFSQFAADKTLNSGWGLTFNWGTLTPNAHILRALIHSTSGELLSTEPRTVIVVKPGDFEFLDQFSLAKAIVRVAEGELIVQRVEVRDKSTQQEKLVDLRYGWSTGSQSMQAVAATTTAVASSSRSFFTGAFAALAKQFVGLVTSDLARAASSITSFLESPEQRQEVSGIGLIRGWAFPDMPGATIEHVRLVLDGNQGGSIPCCTRRGDVAATYPDNPNALTSGWGLALNYGILPAGPHTIGIQIEDSTGAALNLDHNITVVKVGDFEFLDQFDLSAASARIVQRHPWALAQEIEEILVEGVRVRDKASQQTKVVDLSLRWTQSSQALEIVASAEQDGA